MGAFLSVAFRHKYEMDMHVQCTAALCDVATGWFDSRAFYRPVPVLGANEGASFSRAIEITAAVLSVRGVAAHNMALVIYHMPFLSTGIMPGGSNALVAALYRQ